MNIRRWNTAGEPEWPYNSRQEQTVHARFARVRLLSRKSRYAVT